MNIQVNGLVITVTLSQIESDALASSSTTISDILTNVINGRLNGYLDEKIITLTDKNPNKLTLEEKITLVGTL